MDKKIQPGTGRASSGKLQAPSQSLTDPAIQDIIGQNRKDNMRKTIKISEAVERMITAINIVTGDDGQRSKRAVVTFLELLKMEDKDYAKQQQYYG
jgi:hypothetical protein